MRINGGKEKIKYANGKLIIDVSAVEDDVLKLMAYINKGKKVSIDIKREKRSLDANNYFWELLGKLALKLSNDGIVYTAEQLYRYAIMMTGEPTYLPIKKEAVEAFKRIWRGDKTGRMVRPLHDSKLPGYVVVAAYVGSSEYDSKEMSRLIDYVVEECQSQGIETKPKQYVDTLLNEWNGGYTNGRNENG